MQVGALYWVHIAATLLPSFIYRPTSAGCPRCEPERNLVTGSFELFLQRFLCDLLRVEHHGDALISGVGQDPWTPSILCEEKTTQCRQRLSLPDAKTAASSAQCAQSPRHYDRVVALCEGTGKGSPRRFSSVMELPS